MLKKLPNGVELHGDGAAVAAIVASADYPEVTGEAVAAADAAERLALVKAECRHRIYAIASQEAQTNVATALGVALVTAIIDRTDEEKATIAAARAGLAWVKAMRETVPLLAADPAVDFRADDEWPACPPAAAAVYSSF